MTCSTVGAGFNGFFILAIDKNIDLLDEVEPDGSVCDGEDAQGDPMGCFIFHTISIRYFEGMVKSYSCSMTTVPEIRTSFPSLVKKNHPSVWVSELI